MFSVFSCFSVSAALLRLLSSSHRSLLQRRCAIDGSARSTLLKGSGGEEQETYDVYGQSTCESRRERERAEKEGEGESERDREGEGEGEGRE